MYNLFVSFDKNSWNGEPFLIESERCIKVNEYTNSKIVEKFGELNPKKIENVKKFPCIFAYEFQCNKNPKFGYVEEIERRQNKLRIKYRILNLNKFLSYSELSSMLLDFDIAEYEMNRTHWAIKEVDIYKELVGKGMELSNLKRDNGGRSAISINGSTIYGNVVGRDNKILDESVRNKRKWWEKLEIIISIVIAFLTFTVAFISIPWWPLLLKETGNQNINTQRVSLLDVQYELADEKGSLIRRWNWQDRPIFNSKAENISRMILSIKLRNPNNFGLFAHIKNENEISEMQYVTDLAGDFQNENYLIPSNGDTGFIFGIDITPFTKITTLTTSSNTQEIEIYNKEGDYLDKAQSNIGKVYGMYIPYVVDILDEEKKLIDTLKFRIRCRAVIGELKAILSDGIEGVDGAMTKSLDFECIPTF